MNRTGTTSICPDNRASKRVSCPLLVLAISLLNAVSLILWTTLHFSGRYEGNLHSDIPAVVETTGDDVRRGAAGRRLSSPACHPHLRVAVPDDYDSLNGGANGGQTPADDGGTDARGGGIGGDNGPPFSRIYFYHVRKAGGTLVRKYLKKVARRYGVHLEVREHGYADEVPGKSKFGSGTMHNTLYVTNLRDPVERSISHFKYEGRWDCQQLVKNASFAPTLRNARPFRRWNETGGIEPSPCDTPFSFHLCAVNCHVQTFSGKGCTETGWADEYSTAIDVLRRYNVVVVQEKLRDPLYVDAIEKYFGVDGLLDSDADMFCGPEAREANVKFPLAVDFRTVLELTKLNKMDTKLYKEMITSCWPSTRNDSDAGGSFFEKKPYRGKTKPNHRTAAAVYSTFPRAYASRFAEQRDPQIID